MTKTFPAVENPTDGDLVWINRTVHNHAVIVHVAGEVDLLSSRTVDSQLEIAESLVVPPAPVVLDLTATAFFGSAGLSLLFKHTARCAKLGSQLLVVANHETVLRPITISGLDEAVEVVPTLAMALERRAETWR